MIIFIIFFFVYYNTLNFKLLWSPPHYILPLSLLFIIINSYTTNIYNIHTSIQRIQETIIIFYFPNRYSSCGTKKNNFSFHIFLFPRQMYIIWYTFYIWTIIRSIYEKKKKTGEWGASGGRVLL